MHKEILTQEQKKLLPLTGKFAEDFGLVGGTAIALQIGHRRSIDFDLFSLKEFDDNKVRNTVKKEGWNIETVLREEKDQFTFLINGVQLTFLYYPYQIEFPESLESFVKMPDLLTLAAMKAFTLARRAKWKDYIDLYFLMKKYYSLGEIVDKAGEIFGTEFNERIFREALAFFDDVNYEEKIEFMPGFEADEETIKKSLENHSVS